jgi:hypothetical protein
MSLANTQLPQLSATENSRATQTWPLIAAAVLAVFYLVTSIVIASHRLLWYDEIFAVMISRLPSLSAIWQAMAHASDLLPPTYYMLVRLFEAPFAAAEVGARLPSALAMVAGLLITFDCARRLTDGRHGLIAFALLTCSSLPYYGYEARSYGLYFMFASLALWIWIHGRDSKPTAVLFGVVIFLAVAVHYYAVLCLVPYGAWEIYAGKMRPWPSAKLMAGCIGVFCALALFFAQVQALRGLVGDFWATPSMLGLAALFSDFFPYGGLLLMVAVLWIALAARNEGSDHPGTAGLAVYLDPADRLRTGQADYACVLQPLLHGIAAGNRGSLGLSAVAKLFHHSESVARHPGPAAALRRESTARHGATSRAHRSLGRAANQDQDHDAPGRFWSPE